MDLRYNDERTNKFITNVGLVTSKGPFGDNIMACEWTHHISHSPGLIAIGINPRAATHENIMESKEFGVSIASQKQASLSSISGNNTGKKVLKISALQELGFKFFKAKNIDVQMVAGAALTMECKVIHHVKLGSHTLFIGEIVDATATEEEPLAYHAGKYWKLDSQIPKPTEEEINHTKEVLSKHRK